MSIEKKSAVSEDQVVAYLRMQPEFFQDHLDLLEKMHIPHPSGSAISLISKQLQLFRTKHQELENQLIALIEIARENDASLNRMHELTLALLEANTLEEVIANLNMVFAECFVTDFTAIKIIKNAAAPAISHLFVEPGDARLKIFANELKTNQPKCGRPSLAQAQFLFGNDAAEVRSAAIIPMAYTRLEGIVAIGSRDDTRFHYSMGNLFLMQMSEIIATRLISLLRDIE